MEKDLSIESVSRVKAKLEWYLETGSERLPIIGNDYLLEVDKVLV